MDLSNLNTFPTSGKRKELLPYTKECDDIFTLDIECSNGWIKDGKVIGYEPGHDESYWNSLTAISLCYHWRFTMNEQGESGRYLKDVVDILKSFPSDTHVIIWVQNLEYEFAFLSNYLEWGRVFARDKHKPMSATPKDFPNIEFRCSYMLTRLSLEAWGKQLGFPKSKDLAYHVLRTPLTAMTGEEEFYCDRDCEIVYRGISKYKEKYKHVYKIPLTQTGEIRKEVKKRIFKNNKLYHQIIKLIPDNSYMYSVMKATFQGGYVHSNMLYTGITMKNGCSFDISSSYPACMCSEKYPMTPFVPAVFEEDKIDEYAYLIRVELKDVESKILNHYISYDHCISISGDLCDNGRVVSAKSLEMWVTEQDWMTIKAAYKFKAQIKECYRSHKDYLPKELVEYVLELYENKTQYKDVPGFEEIYYQAKQFINALFGMCVTDLIFDDVDFKDLKWTKVEKTYNEVDAYILDLKEHNNHRTFLAYQWGIWISAYARRNLWVNILKYDEDVVYDDTDSLKILLRGKAPDFTEYNNAVTAKLEAICDLYGIDKAKLSPKDPKGVEHPLGHFVREQDWSEFRTLGAKRYVARYKSDGQLHLTVSGINKEAVSCLKDDIENFNESVVFDKDAEGVKKKLRIYTHDQPEIVWNAGQYDEYRSTEKEGIVIRPTSYSLSITDEYMTILSQAKNYLKCI